MSSPRCSVDPVTRLRSDDRYHHCHLNHKRLYRIFDGLISNPTRESEGNLVPVAGKTRERPKGNVARHPGELPAAGTLHTMQAQPQPVWNYIMEESSDILDRVLFAKPVRGSDASRHLLDNPMRILEHGSLRNW